ncbi:MAG: tetratricopeptide repeat protein, partial [Chloroflexota bacterium]|nr:tetratricopeptide repeat protein [Chloroflexota bacterium]
LAQAAEAGLRGADMVPWLNRLDVEMENVRAALEWSFEAEPETALRLCVAMAAYGVSRSIDSDGVRWMARAADLALSLPPAAPPDARERMILVSRVLATAANATSLGGEARTGGRWAEQAVALAREARDDKVLSDALSALATTRVFSGQLTEARDLADEMLRLARSRDDWLAVAMIEASVAYFVVVGPDGAASAEAGLQRASDAADRSGNLRAIAFIAAGRGELLAMTGRLDEARGWFRRAITGYEAMGDRKHLLMARSEFAHALRRTGEIDEAQELYRETLHGWQHAGNRGAIANQLECFGFLAIAKSDLLHAARLFGAAEVIREVAEAVMVGNEREEYDAAISQLRDRLDATALEAAWAEGRRLTTDEAVALALSA